MAGITNLSILNHPLHIQKNPTKLSVNVVPIFAQIINHIDSYNQNTHADARPIIITETTELDCIMPVMAVPVSIDSNLFLVYFWIIALAWTHK